MSTGAKSLQDICIGILGGGFQGRNIAFWFALREFKVIVCDVDKEQLGSIEQEISNNKKKRLLKRFVSCSGHLQDLRDCDLVIECVPEHLELKRSVLLKLEKIVNDDAILASNSSTFPPTVIAEPLARKESFINIHYLGVSFGNARLELIPGQFTSERTYKFCKQILEKADFQPVRTGECPGFVFNRITLVQVGNLLRVVEKGLVSLENVLKYMVFHRMSLPFASLDFIGLDVTEPALRFLNQQLGERFYVSEILAQKVKSNELGKKSGKGFLDHSVALDPKSLGEKHYDEFESSLQRIYINDLQINHTNLVVRLLAKNKAVCFRSQDIPYFSRLERLDQKLFAKVVNACCFDQAEEIKSSYDLIIDSPPLEAVGSLAQRIKAIQRRCLSPIPLAINIPIYRIEEIAAQTDHPTLVFGINCQKSYLGNTEVVRRAKANPAAFEQLKLLIGELAGDCIEVNDDYARPLTFQMVSKMFEAIRVVEEGIATLEEIEHLLINDPVFRDIDYFGLDNLLQVAEYCQSIYGEPFESPRLLRQMIKRGQVGVAAGQGFYRYA